MTNDELETMMLAFEIVQVLFVFAFGACIGSLINVLVYRLPLGLDVVTPTSRCPSCGTKLTWRENVPILGWLALRGRCRFCRSPISSEYPIVEAFVALLFVALYLVLYADQGRFLGIHFGAVRPEWAFNGFRLTWPQFIIWVVLFSCLTAATIIDARTFHIPMVLTWVPAGVGVIFHIGHALWVHFSHTHLILARGWHWTIATPGPNDWPWIGGAFGGVLGLAIGNVMLARGMIGRSFADYEEWEKKALAEGEADAAIEPAGKVEAQTVVPGDRDAITTPASNEPTPLPPPSGRGSESPITELWIQYPHARREMLREMVFLAPCVGFALAGAGLAVKLAGPWAANPATGIPMAAVQAPQWMLATAGTLLGFLIGGGFLWLMRIVFSLALGKEALGLGDIHLMAAVGACLGWIDAVLAFFGAALVGLLWAVLGMVGGGKIRRALPFGPYLAIATLLVVLTKPLIELGLGKLLPAYAPINVP